MDKAVPYSTEDRQWDLRINVQEDEYLNEILSNVQLEIDAGKFKYVLIGGPEVGTKPNHSDYQVRHIHAAIIFNNRASKASIIKNWGIKEGNGYYMVPRNRELTYVGWRDHHTKEFSKVDPNNLVLLESGEIPQDTKKRKAITFRSDAEKKMCTNDIVKHMRDLIQHNKDDEAFELYPRNYIQYGEKIKALIHQKQKSFFGKRTDPHIYLYGFAGSGKTSLMKWLYPNTYKKDLLNRFFDLYDDKIHTHIMLEDLDMDNIEKLTVQFLKTICDEAGFTIDQKYKTPQPTRSTILITSNYSIEQLITHDNTSDVETTKAALRRRFFHLRVDQLHRMLGVKLIPDYERKQLKKAGNDDPSALYISWDYILDTPTGLPLKTVEEYQQIVRDNYYR